MEYIAQDAQIDPRAIVEKGARIGSGSIIEPYAIVKKNVVLKDRVIIKSHAYIDGYTTIGEETVVYPSASIGTKTQAKNFRGEKTTVNIGKGCEIREFVTINSSLGENSSVNIGNNCLLMAYCHVAHHCSIGNEVILANGVMLAGHVELGDFVNIGGMTPVHQFVRIGSHAMVGGLSRITHDIPPFTIGGGVPYKLAGINLVGLKRKGVDIKVRNALANAFKLTYRSSMKLADAIEMIGKEVEAFPEVLSWIDFCTSSTRGLIADSGFEYRNACGR